MCASSAAYGERFHEDGVVPPPADLHLNLVRRGGKGCVWAKGMHRKTRRCILLQLFLFPHHPSSSLLTDSCPPTSTSRPCTCFLHSGSPCNAVAVQKYIIDPPSHPRQCITHSQRGDITRSTRRTSGGLEFGRTPQGIQMHHTHTPFQGCCFSNNTSQAIKQ